MKNHRKQDLLFKNFEIPELTKENVEGAKDGTSLRLFKVCKALNTADRRTLLKASQAEPDHLGCRVALLGAFSDSDKRNHQNRKNFNEIYSWFVQNFPDAFVVLLAGYDVHPDDFAIFKEKWLTRIDLNPENTKIMENAAAFFQVFDAASAIELLKRGDAKDENPYWTFEIVQILAKGFTQDTSNVHDLSKYYKLFVHRCQEHGLPERLSHFQIEKVAALLNEKFFF